MKLKKEFKRDTQLIAVIVILMTILTLNISYSAFFSVKTQSTIHEIDAGTLSIVIDNTSTPIYEDLLPTQTSELPTHPDSVVNSKYSVIDFTNNGTIDAEYALTISRDYDTLPSLSTDDDLLDFSYLNVGIFDVINNSWINFGTLENPVYYATITNLNSVTGTNDVHTLLTDKISVNANKQYRVYVWLSEETPVAEIGKLVSLKLSIDYTTIKDETMGSDEIAMLENN